MRALIIAAGLLVAACQKEAPVSVDNVDQNQSCTDADGRTVECPAQ